MRLTDSHSAEKNVIPEKHLILCLVGSMARTGDFQSSDTGSIPVRGLWVCSKSVMHRSFKPKEAGSTPVMPICPRRLKDRPGGYGPSDARSTRAGDTVTVADMAMQRIVDPSYAGSNPVSHLQINPSLT